MVMQADATGRSLTRTEISALSPRSTYKPTKLSDYLIPATLGLGTGLRTGSQLLAGFEYSRVGKFNAEQIQNQIRELGVSSILNMRQFSRQAVKLEGQQRTVIATTNLAFSGSLVDVMTDTQTQIELQRLEMQRQTDLKIQALQTQRQLTEREARVQTRGAYLSAFSEAATGIAGLLERL